MIAQTLGELTIERSQDTSDKVITALEKAGFVVVVEHDAGYKVNYIIAEVIDGKVNEVTKNELR